MDVNRWVVGGLDGWMDECDMDGWMDEWEMNG